MNCAPCETRLQPAQCAGMSLVELMVAMVIGLTLIAGVGRIYLGSKQTYRVQQAYVQMQENGRYGIQTMAQDLRRAGYMGGNGDINAINGTLGPTTVADSCNTGDTTWGRMIGRRIFGIDDARTGYACIPASGAGAYLRGDVVVSRYAAPWEATSFDASRLYVRSSLFTGRIFAGSDQNDAANRVDQRPRRTAELLAHGYYIGVSPVTCNGASIPALFQVYPDANGRPISEELVRGADQLQVQFGVGTNGSVAQYFDADNVPNWSNVISVRLWLLMRTDCPEIGYTDTKDYVMGDQIGLDEYTPNDGFRRQLYSSTVMLRNGA